MYEDENEANGRGVFAYGEDFRLAQMRTPVASHILTAKSAATD